MKRIFFFAAALASLAVAVRAELATGIGVVVDDSVITVAQVEQGMEHNAQTDYQLYGTDRARYAQEIQKLRDQEIERLVEDQLIVHEFTSAGYTTNVLEAFIDERIQKRIQQQYYGDRSRLIKTLQAEGITYETFRNQMRDQIIIEYMNYQNGSNPKKILISPLKIEQYYADHKNDFKVDDEVHLFMIAIPQPAATPGSAHKMAAEILAKIDAGASFQEMAGVYSAGTQRSVGGDRGWIDRGYLKPELTTPAFALKPGQHSGVIDLPEASYILMVSETRPAHIRPLSEVRGDIERTLLAKENTHLRDQWMERLKRKNFVRYY